MNHLPQKTWPPENRPASKRRCKNSGDGEGEKFPGNLPSTKPGGMVEVMLVAKRLKMAEN